MSRFFLLPSIKFTFWGGVTECYRSVCFHTLMGGKWSHSLHYWFILRSQLQILDTDLQNRSSFILTLLKPSLVAYISHLKESGLFRQTRLSVHHLLVIWAIKISPGSQFLIFRPSGKLLKWTCAWICQSIAEVLQRGHNLIKLWVLMSYFM